MPYVKGKKANPFYLTKEWRMKRLEILDRDKHECLWCKEQGKVTTDQDTILEVDHIKELEDYPELAFNNDNLRTLCRSCHNKRHKRFGFTRLKNKWADDEKW